jgi:hypothetical protein
MTGLCMAAQQHDEYERPYEKDKKDDSVPCVVIGFPFQAAESALGTVSFIN